GRLVHSVYSFANSGSCFCLGSRVSLTDAWACAADVNGVARARPAIEKSARRAPRDDRNIRAKICEPRRRMDRSAVRAVAGAFIYVTPSAIQRTVMWDLGGV